MESALEALGAVVSDEAPCDLPLSSAALPSPPPADPHRSAPPTSSKRRWSPCTWRYAIEDAQAELPSRPPRVTAPLGSTAQPPHSSSQQLQQQSIRFAKPSCYNPLYGRAGEKPQRNSSKPPSRLHVVVEPPPHAQSSAFPQFKSRTRERYRKSHHHHHHHLHSSSKARPGEEAEVEEGGDTEEDADAFDDDHHHHELAVYNEEYFKIRRRELSPSELYFCTMCSKKDAETKGGTDS